MTRINDALARRMANIRNKDQGFTLIELLVVVIIIGILAAIAIPVYIGVQNNAKDAAVKSDLTNAQIALVAFYTAGGTGTPAIADLATYGYKKSSDVLEITLGASPSSTSFCITTRRVGGTVGTATVANDSYKITQDGAAVKGIC